MTTGPENVFWIGPLRKNWEESGGGAHFILLAAAVNCSIHSLSPPQIDMKGTLNKANDGK